MAEARGLGRGLDALLGGVRAAQDPETPVDTAAVSAIPVANIHPNPHQPRREFDEEALGELADSIRAQGVLQPILVRPTGEDAFELVAGERRLRASKLAGLDEIPALVREMTDQQSLAIALIENLQREDLNPIEEALGYRRLMQEFELSQEELARQVGKSRSALANSLRLLQLPDAIQKDIETGVITAGHARALMALGEPDAVDELLERIKRLSLSVRQAEAEATYFKKHGALPGEEEEDDTPAMQEADAGPSRKPASPREPDPELEALRRAVAEATGLKVSASGDASAGALTLRFSSREELDGLARSLGAEAQ